MTERYTGLKEWIVIISVDGEKDREFTCWCVTELAAQKYAEAKRGQFGHAGRIKEIRIAPEDK